MIILSSLYDFRRNRKIIKKVKTMFTLKKIIICSLIFISTAFAEVITVYTEEFPPYNYFENEKMTGISTEIVEALFKDSGLEMKIEILPWNRAYSNVLHTKNSFIYSISRLEKREELFGWIGKLLDSSYYIYCLKERDDIVISDFKDMKSYMIGTTKNDARETYLLGKGFQLKDFQRITGDDSNLKNYLKLKLGRIELWPMPEAVANYVVQKHGDNPGKVLKKVFRLNELSKGYYLAANKNTDKELLLLLEKNLEHLKSSEKYKKILKMWGMSR